VFYKPNLCNLIHIGTDHLGLYCLNVELDYELGGIDLNLHNYGQIMQEIFGIGVPPMRIRLHHSHTSHISYSPLRKESLKEIST